MAAGHPQASAFTPLTYWQNWGVSGNLGEAPLVSGDRSAGSSVSEGAAACPGGTLGDRHSPKGA